MLESLKLKITIIFLINKCYDKIFSDEDEMEDIISEISTDINECNAKQSKDIVILIDFNLYGNDSNNISNSKIDAFLDQTKTILNNYLSNNDRLGVFIYTKQYQIICPLMRKKQIDIDNFSKDLNYYNI